MTIEIFNREDRSAKLVELIHLPREGEKFIARNGNEFLVFRVVHTPFDSNRSVRIIVGIRGSLAES
jgi:hypothetical protein